MIWKTENDKHWEMFQRISTNENTNESVLLSTRKKRNRSENTNHRHAIFANTDPLD